MLFLNLYLIVIKMIFQNSWIPAISLRSVVIRLLVSTYCVIITCTPTHLLHIFWGIGLHIATEACNWVILSSSVPCDVQIMLKGTPNMSVTIKDPLRSKQISF